MLSVHSTPRELENGRFTLKTHQMFSVHTTPRELENERFTLKTHQMFSVHATPGELEKGRFTLKTHQMFSVHTTPNKIKNATMIDLLDFCLKKTRSGKLLYYHEAVVFKKLRFINAFSPHGNEKPAFWNFSGLKNVFEKPPVFMVD